MKLGTLYASSLLLYSAAVLYSLLYFAINASNLVFQSSSLKDDTSATVILCFSCATLFA